MPRALYQITIGPSESFTIELDTAQPIWKLIDQIVEERHLPTADEDGQPISYSFFARPGDDYLVLSREQSLERAGYPLGSTLFLASRAEPWWENGPSLTRPMPARVANLPWAQWLLAASILLIVALLGWPFLNRFSRTALEDEPSPESSQVTEAPTVTLAPEPTSGPLSVGPSASATSMSTANTQVGANPVISPTNTLNPSQPEFTVAGVRQEYRNRDQRLFSNDPPGAFLWAEPALQKKLPATRGWIIITNGDLLTVLDENTPGLYKVRVLTNQLDRTDTRVLGAEGWLPRWLVDNLEVPAPPATQTPRSTPTIAAVEIRRFRAELVRTYPGSPDSSEHASCIEGRVTYSNGAGVGAAVIYANNGSSNTPSIVSNANGEYRFCGLGYSNWSLVLSFVPRRGNLQENALQRQVVQTFFVNGSSSQTVVINFRER